MLELQGNGCFTVCGCLFGSQHIHQSVVFLVVEEYSTVIGIIGLRLGIPSNDIGRLRALPVYGLDIFHRTRCGIGYLVYAHLVAALELHVELIAYLPHTTHAVGIILRDPCPRLFARLGSDAYAANLQGVFAFGQSRALLAQFVLRAGGKQQHRHKAYC